MDKSTHRIKRLIKKSQRGATAVEYGLLVALISIVTIGGVTVFGTNLSSMFHTVGSKIAVAAPTAPDTSTPTTPADPFAGVTITIRDWKDTPNPPPLGYGSWGVTYSNGRANSLTSISFDAQVWSVDTDWTTIINSAPNDDLAELNSINVGYSHNPTVQCANGQMANVQIDWAWSNLNAPSPNDFFGTATMDLAPLTAPGGLCSGSTVTSVSLSVITSTSAGQVAFAEDGYSIDFS